MKDIWGKALGKRLKAVVYKEGPKQPQSQLFLVFEGEKGDVHVEIYSQYDVRWAGGVDPGGVAEIVSSGRGEVVKVWE